MTFDAFLQQRRLVYDLIRKNPSPRELKLLWKKASLIYCPWCILPECCRHILWAHFPQVRLRMNLWTASEILYLKLVQGKHSRMAPEKCKTGELCKKTRYRPLPTLLNTAQECPHCRQPCRIRNWCWQPCTVRNWASRRLLWLPSYCSGLWSKNALGRNDLALCVCCIFFFVRNGELCTYYSVY